MIKRQWIISTIVTLLFLVLAAVVFQNFKAQKKSMVSESPAVEEILKVATEKFTSSDVKSKISIDGRVNAYEKIDIAAEVTGRLLATEKKWKEGTYFTKGELLFQIDNDDERYNLFAQRSSLLNAITQIMPDLKFDYPEAFDKWKAYLDAFDAERTTPPLPEISSEQEKYYIAGKNILNTYYTIKSAEKRLGDYMVYAPFNGVFLTINAFPGSIVNPGASLGNIMNTSRYEMSTPINAKDFNFIRVGQSVSLIAEDLGKSYKGTISRISTQIDQTTQSIPVYISVSGRGLRDGMYLKGDLIGNTLKDVITLPREALVSQDQIYVLRDSFITVKNIDVILRNEEGVYARGILPDDEVIVSGLNSLSPGRKAIPIKL